MPQNVSQIHQSNSLSPLDYSRLGSPSFLAVGNMSSPRLDLTSYSADYHRVDLVDIRLKSPKLRVEVEPNRHPEGLPGLNPPLRGSLIVTCVPGIILSLAVRDPPFLIN